MLASICVALGLAACTAGTASAPPLALHSQSSSRPVPSQRPVSRPPTPQQQLARAEAQAIAESFAVPPGGSRLARQPRGFPLLSSNFDVGSLAAHDVTYWVAPGTPKAVLAWEKAHLPARFTLGAANFGPGYSLFRLPPTDLLVTRQLALQMNSVSGGRTAIRVDAQVAWQPARPAAEAVPSAVRVVTVTQVPALSPGSSRAHPSATITDPARVRKLAALVNGLSLFVIPAYASCAEKAGANLSLTFRGRPGGPALADLQTGQPCGSASFSIHGLRQQPLIDEPTLNVRILTLAGLPWKLTAGAS